MSTWNNVTLTTQGASLLAKQAQGSPLTITKAEAGAGYVDPTQLASQTAVNQVKQELNLQPATLSAPDTCTIAMTLANDNLAAGYTATQVGVYAQDTTGEILLFIAQAEEGEGTEVPSATEMPGYSAEWRFYLKYSNSDNVTVNVSDTNMVSIATFNSHADNTDNPHSVTKEQVGLGNVDNTSDADKPVSMATLSALNKKADSSALTAHTGNTNNPHQVTATQVGLGKVNNTSDADKPVSTATQNALNAKADASALTAHTSNKSNPHGVTAAQVGLGSVNNTSDADKPVSAATQAALDLKQNKITFGTAAPTGGSNGDIYIQY